MENTKATNTKTLYERYQIALANGKAERITVQQDKLTIESNGIKEEYTNAYGLKALQYDEIISHDCGKMYLTAVNCAITITRIKREHTKNLTIHKWLDELDTALKCAWRNIDSNGKIHGLTNNNRKEDVENAIQECILYLYQFIGQPYSVEVHKKVRNAYGKVIDDKARPADSFATEEVNTDAETIENAYRPVFTEDNAPIHNKNLIKAIKSCDFSDTDLDILYRISNGETAVSVSQDIGISNSMVSRKYRKMIKALQSVMIE